MHYPMIDGQSQRMPLSYGVLVSYKMAKLVMNKHLEIDSNTINEQIKDFEPLELIVWAFEHGYKLGQHDMREGIHIKTSELKKQLANDIEHYLNNLQSKTN